MSATDTAAVIGAISGLVSLLALIYLAGYWKGKVDMKLRELCNHPLPEISLMIKTLWNIYVVDALQRRPDLFEHHSAYRMKDEGRAIIPDDFKEKLQNFNFDGDEPDSWQVVKALGVEDITMMADGKDITVQEAIALLTLYVREECA